MRDHQNQRGMSNDDINLIQMLILPQLPSASLFNFPKKISLTDSFWEGFECECTLTGSVSQMQDWSIFVCMEFIMGSLETYLLTNIYFLNKLSMHHKITSTDFIHQFPGTALI